jgi:hypothetical protein
MRIGSGLRVDIGVIAGCSTVLKSLGGWSRHWLQFGCDTTAHFQLP